MPKLKYGKRHSGGAKGSGWLGEINTTNENGEGITMTEVSTTVTMGRRGDVEIPLINRNTTKKELEHLAKGKKPTPEMINKAAHHAELLIRKGKSPFKEKGRFVE